MEKLQEIYYKTFFLIILKDVRRDNVVEKFISLIESIVKQNDFDDVIKRYSLFIVMLDSMDLSNYIKDKLPQITKKEGIEKELEIISQLCKINYETIKDVLYTNYGNYKNIIDALPYFKNSQSDITINDIKIQEKSRTFVFDDNLKLISLNIKEPLCFNDLKGYSEQKKVLYDNTKALLEGKKVNNILLYGDAGCGKSTSVRALLNEFNDINIVQIFKNNLINLDKLYEILRNKDEKYIIFADDISFDENDENISTMKAIIEGSLVQCPNNAVIYATSNRRHLIKESFQSRKGDEVHLNDTLNEISSISDRFGINLLFAKPNNKEFIDIVLKLADEYEINIDSEILIQKAQRLALIKGSKSPRIARQLIDNLRNNMYI